MTKIILVSYSFLLVLLGCQVNNDTVLDKTPQNIQNIVQLNDAGVLGKPIVTLVNSDSLDVRKAVGRKVNIISNTFTPNSLSKVKAKNPDKVKIDFSKVAIHTPGKAGLKLPKQFEIPKSGFLIQNEDTVYAPEINIALQPMPVKVQPMRFRDAALHDIQYLDVGQGLPSSYIDAIYEDPVGNMWFGSYGAGLSRYDGNTITTYTMNEGLPNNVIFRILRDKKGNLWLGTEEGVSKYDGNTFSNYGLEQGLNGIFLGSILEDNDGNIWFGIDGGGITKYSSDSADTFTNYTINNGLPSDKIYSSTMDHEGNLWFGSRNGLIKFDGESFSTFTIDDGLPDNIIRGLYCDKKGRIWIGSDGGISIYDGEFFTNYNKTHGLPSNWVWLINEDYEGNIWIGTDGGGACKVSFNSTEDVDDIFFTYFSKKEGLSFDFLRAMYADKSGNMWFGVDGSGISKFRTNSFSSFTNNEQLSVNSVWSIYEDNSQNLWFGSDQWGIYKYSRGQFTSYMDEEGLLEFSVLQTLEDRMGNMWFATYGGGVFKFDGKSFISFTESEGLANADIYSMLEDRNGNILLGTQGDGLIKYDGKNFTTYNKKDGLPNERIWKLIEDRDGKIWIGTYGGGVTIFDGNSFTTYSEEQGLINNGINSILEDHSGNVWLGTDDGLNKIVFAPEGSKEKDKIYSFKMAEGLTHNMTLSLIEDKEYNIWIGTEGGITLLGHLEGQAGKNEKYLLNTFVQEDGLRGLDVVINSVCLDSENRMWWGSGKGLSMLELDNLDLTEASPRIQLNNVTVGQEYIDFRQLQNQSYRDSLTFGVELMQSFDSLIPFNNYPHRLDLPYDLNQISFNYSAIDWQGLHKVKYQTKLEGYDKGWNMLTKKIIAEYRNLEYGKYTFKVRAINASNQWSETIEYPFSIVRPWWHSWWARFIYFVLGLIAIYSFDRWRTYLILKKQKQLQLSIEQRNKELATLVRDRTMEIKRQQKITEEANMALEQKVNERTIELVHKNEKLAEYAFVNAHNLRVPVANIKGIIQLFELVNSPKEEAELIELLKGESNNLDDVLFEIKEMLENDKQKEKE